MALATKNQTELADRRGSTRRRLCLDAQVESSGGSTAAVVLHDLSPAGFLMGTSAQVAAGEPLRLRLPGASDASALVIWSCGRHFGCEFKQPFSTAAVCAALLRARPAHDSERRPPRVQLQLSEAADTSFNAAEQTRALTLRPALWSSLALWILLIAFVVLATS